MREINLCTVLIFRDIGQGYIAIITFCYLMSMSFGMTKRGYHNINNRLPVAYFEASRVSTNRTYVMKNF